MIDCISAIILSTMQTTLYLTKAEQALFEELQASLQDGWSVEIEKLTYKDDAERRQVRLDLMNIDDGHLEAVIAKCGPNCSEEELEKLIAHVDLTKMSQKDLWEICFALGPVAMEYLISKLLIDAKTDAAIEGIMALSHLRHDLLESLQPV